MITIKCFGDVEICGNGDWPAGVTLQSEKEITFHGDVKLWESEGEKIEAFVKLEKGAGI